jgi:nitrate reductase gamma subunit
MALFRKQKLKGKKTYSVKLKATEVLCSLLIFTLFILSAPNSFSQDGEALFQQHCGVCHAMTSKDLVGPGMAGVADRRSEEWLTEWILNPMKMVEGGDEQAVEVYEKFNQVPMPAFEHLSEDDINALVQYIQTAEEVPQTAGVAVASSNEAAGNTTATDTNNNTSWVFWTLIGLIALLFGINRYQKRVFEKLGHNGFHAPAHQKPKTGQQLLTFVLISTVLIWLLVEGLQANLSVVNLMSFTVLPYAAFAVFIIGSIYRYKNRGYQVSSLSSQFLEGKKLFWGSQPFHWGLLVIFFGHLIAFLFPSAILAWNGQPVRLLILEISSFAFGLSVLLGLILLIKRRMTSRMLLVVSNRMDMLVYTILFVQVLSGLGVAFFVRWGSSWFSSVLTPYLRSVFSFNPDIVAVSDMPWLIQVHIVSAFVFIGVIPFTRFMHFLVAPIDYLWRRYQLVVWNWNPKAIRRSKQHTYGKKTKNH